MVIRVNYYTTSISNPFLPFYTAFVLIRHVSLNHLYDDIYPTFRIDHAENMADPKVSIHLT